MCEPRHIRHQARICTPGVEQTALSERPPFTRSLALVFPERSFRVAMKTALLYERPVALSRDAHRHLRLVSSKASFSYARATNCVPLACSEFSLAATQYPIVFSADKDDERVPVALLGIRENENLFVSADGAWQAGYIPAFVRRYPFLLAARDEPRNFTICVDEAYAALASG